MAADETLLVLSGMGVPLYSARGLSQTLTPIAASISVRRTANGSLKDLSASQFRKYASTISGRDQRSPALSGIWPGMQITVDCIEELTYATGGTPERTVVSGSSRVEGTFTSYRPQIVFRVIGFSTQTDEWGAIVSWSLNLEEV